jgi:hypothetical protein
MFAGYRPCPNVTPKKLAGSTRISTRSHQCNFCVVITYKRYFCKRVEQCGAPRMTGHLGSAAQGGIQNLHLWMLFQYLTIQTTPTASHGTISMSTIPAL